jgi:hypothetical protein
MERYLVISSDTHAGPPSEAYRDYVDPEFREAFDRDLEQSLALRSLVLESASAEQEKFRVDWESETGDGGRKASYDPATRNAELDREGIAGEVIFPDADVLGGGASAPFSAGLQSSGELDGALVQAGARAHNRWLAELCSESPERRCGVATIPVLHDVAWAVAEMARVAAKVVLVEDTLYTDERVEEAEKLRDPTHVRSYTEAEWRDFFAAAGLEVEEVACFEKRHELDDWLARTGCAGEEAERVRGLLAHVTDGDHWTDTKILLRGRAR